MSNVKIGSARIDEHGKARGGRAGDQTGKEVSTQNWYNHVKGWRVFRAKNPMVATAIAWDMQAACDNKHIGYDQSQRDTLYNVSKPLNFNCSRVKTNCETDCSALVRVCCAYAGVNLPNFRTSNEANVLLKSGAFVEMKGDKFTKSYQYLCKGDILVTKTQGHTVVVLNNGPKAPERVNPLTFDHVLVTGESVYLRVEPNTHSDDYTIVHKGTLLPYLGANDNGWYNVKYDGESLWISSKYSVLYAD